MYCSVLSATVSGMEMIPVQVEADVSDGMPQFTMVGYVSAQVKEAQDRVRTALKNMGISLPPKRITINLSPADVRKEGSRFDLPIAAGVLMTLGRIPPGSLRKTMVLGELGLDGHVQEISGSGEGAGAWMHNASCSGRKCRGRGSGRRASRRWNPEFTGAFELLL